MGMFYGVVSVCVGFGGYLKLGKLSWYLGLGKLMGLVFFG